MGFGFGGGCGCNDHRELPRRKEQIVTENNDSNPGLLQFLNEEALVIQNGERVFDFNKIENKYGVNYANNLKNDIVRIEEMNDAKAKNPFHRYKRSAWTDCMIDAIKDHFGVAGTLVYYGGKCTYQHG